MPPPLGRALLPAHPHGAAWLTPWLVRGRDALAREGRDFGTGIDLGETYDLVIVGGGISGLAAAHYYRRIGGPDARILILENHDDFGGHAKRNEFHHDGTMRLAWGGVFNLEFPMFSQTVNTLLAELGVDIDRLLAQSGFNYGEDGRLGPATYFDAETYGRDVLLPGFVLRHGDPSKVVEQVDLVPLSAESRESLNRFYSTRTDVLAGRSPEERTRFLRSISYTDFFRQHAGLTDEAAEIFVKTTHGYWGVGADSLSAAECEGAGLPMAHLLGGELAKPSGSVGGETAIFPDGNASIARLLARELVPGVAPGRDMEDIVTAAFDYSKLDGTGSSVRLRLNSTVVNVEELDGTVHVIYVRDGTRSNPGRSESLLPDSERLPLGEAIRAHTIDAAYVIGAETYLGSLEVGTTASRFHPRHASRRAQRAIGPTQRGTIRWACVTENLVSTGCLLVQERHNSVAFTPLLDSQRSR